MFKLNDQIIRIIMSKKLLILGAALGLLAVILGAFAAHGLKELITVEEIESFQTGVRYQMYHALLLLVAGSTKRISNRTKSMLFYTVLLGVILFSGSIYGLATGSWSGIDFKPIAFLTPVGGLLLILSWLLLLINFIKSGQDS